MARAHQEPERGLGLLGIVYGAVGAVRRLLPAACAVGRRGSLVNVLCVAMVRRRRRRRGSPASTQPLALYPTGICVGVGIDDLAACVRA